MKKIILILICFLLTGCNYLELNDMGVVSLLAINYENDVYNITVEIKENKKDQDDLSSIYTASSSSIDKALQEISLSVNKTLYFIDLNILMLDEKTANEKLTTIVDYITREVNFGSNFNIVIDDDSTKTLEVIKKQEKTAGEYLKNILDNKENNIINIKYYDFLKSYVSSYNDIILPYCTVRDDEVFIDEAVLFQENEIVKNISLSMVQSYNLLSNEKHEYTYEVYYEDNKLVYNVSKHKAKIKYEDDGFKIKIDVNGSFIEMKNIDLDNTEISEEVLEELKANIASEIKLFVDECIKQNSDVLHFKKTYYNQVRSKLENIKDIKYELEVNVKLDRSGLIFDSLGDVYEKNK